MLNIIQPLLRKTEQDRKYFKREALKKHKLKRYGEEALNAMRSMKYAEREILVLEAKLQLLNDYKDTVESQICTTQVF